MLKYIYMYGWPREGDAEASALAGQSEEQQVNKILDAVSWYYNHRFHHGIKAIPIGTIVYREPSKEHEGTYTKNLHRVYDFDLERKICDGINLMNYA
jgi:hypothetical protein